MSFWGVEVKPGKPFTHKPADSYGRLHISMATLGLGAATKRCTLQCNVGNKSPVYLCCFYPEKTECLQLHLEFDEADEVMFSVLGPRSVHLAGYYLDSRLDSRRPYNPDESESFGEDIADSDTESSPNSEDEEDDDSFIDDGDIEVFPSAPVSDATDSDSASEKVFLAKKGSKPKRKRKERSPDEKNLQAHILKKEDECQEKEAKAENRSLNRRAEMPVILTWSSTEVIHGSSDKAKKKRKKRAVKLEQNKKSAKDEISGHESHEFVDESDGKKVKKKKKSKT